MMRKKQLQQQNSALFAEIERKTGEIAALNLRLKEQQELYAALQAETEALTATYHTLQQEYDALKEHDLQLVEALQDVMYAPPAEQEQPDTDASVFQTDAPLFETVPVADEPIAAEQLTPETPADDPSVAKLEEDLPQDEIALPAEDPTPKSESAASVPISRPDTDLLRAHGAMLIGRLTRQTAVLLSNLSAACDPNAESAKTLLLGKNESFKYQILTLLNTDGSTEEIKTEMDRLAEEAAAYLTASCEGIR